MKNLLLINDQLEKIIAGAEEFKRKKAPHSSLRLDEYFYLLDRKQGTDAVFEAIYHAYNIGFRRGYNRAVKDLAGKLADQ